MATFFYPDGETFEKPEITRIYEFTVKDLPDAVYWVDKDGKFVFVNPAASLMYGYSEDEFSAINVCDLASCSIEKWAEEFLTLKEAGSTTRETEQKSKSGSSIPVEVKSSYFELNGEGYACNVAKDLSIRKRALKELERSELKMRQLLLNSIDAILLTKPDGTIESANPSACKMFQRSEEEICRVGRSGIVDIIDPRLPLALEERAKTGKFFGELTGLLPDGTKFPIEVATAFYHIDGQPHSSMIVRDITLRKKVEAEIQLNSEKLAAINSTKDKFFSMISHDLRSPFHILLNFSQMLLEDADNLSREQIKHYADTLYKSISNLYGLLENLLNWSLVQRDKISFEPQELNLTFVIDQAFEIVSTTALKKEIVLVNGVLQDTLVFADKNMLTTIIQNLVSNGIKFSHRGGSILVTAVKSEDELVLIVSDKGVGIKESDLQALFEQNGNLQTSGTEREKGSGLGLALCREFAKRHGGSLEVISHPGEGSRFFVSFPVSKNGNGI
ncbi:MAG: PAS domain-containing sensor histidine kinase [Ignavibacteria bacterium]|nr:PAS domain-containing sensor histidine kinase [Ignavibacteria bacterium]